MSLHSKYDGIVIVGPTASGKSAVALELARSLNGEIISCDSTHVYRGFNIGTAKPTEEEKKEIPHHMLDLVEWNEDFDAGQYAKKANEIFQDILKRKKVPIIVGGTGLYLRAFLNDSWDDLPSDPEVRNSFASKTMEEIYSELQSLDGERAQELHPNDRFRIERALEVIKITGKPMSEMMSRGESMRDDLFVIYLNPSRPKLEEKILARTAQMLQQGLIEEVKALRANGVLPTCKVMQAIGYAEVNRHLDGQLAKENLPEEILIATRQYAKRQRTWFNKLKCQIYDAASCQPQTFSRLVRFS